MAEKEEENSLFNWAGSEEMSFTAFEEEVNKEPVKEENEKEEEENNSEELDTEDIFSQLTSSENQEEEEKEDLEEEEDKPDNSKTLDSISLLKSMKENGLIDYELEENQELTSELAQEILDGDKEEKVLSEVEKILGELPEDVKNLNRFILNGGNLNDYIKNINTESTLSRDMDIEDPANQSLIVRNKLKEEGFDDDYISDQIAYLTEKGKLKNTATIHFNKWAKEEADKEEALINSQKEKIENQKKEKKALKQKVKDFVTKNEEINGFKFSEEDRKELPAYMTEESVVLEDGRKMTPFQRDILASLADENKAMLMAKLAKSNFDFSSLKETAVTEQTQKVKEKLRNTKDTPPSQSRSGSQTKRLADYF